jgi:hypothetical protein
VKLCPSCGGEGIPIFYGMPAGPPDEIVSTNTGQDVYVYGKGRKRRASAGCVVGSDDRVCLSCGRHWDSRLPS